MPRQRTAGAKSLSVHGRGSHEKVVPTSLLEYLFESTPVTWRTIVGVTLTSLAHGPAVQRRPDHNRRAHRALSDAADGRAPASHEPFESSDSHKFVAKHPIQRRVVSR